MMDATGQTGIFMVLYNNRCAIESSPVGHGGPQGASKRNYPWKVVMSDRDRAAAPAIYLEIPAILGRLLRDLEIRNLAQVAREALHVALAALSFRAPGFSSATSVFVRDTLVMPMDFAPCAITATGDHVVIVPHLKVDRDKTDETLKLRSYAGCAVLDWQSNCVGVFYVMDTEPHHFSAQETSQLRALASLVSSQIEIVRRFGTSGPGPSPKEIIRRADLRASVGQTEEAQALIALAYAAHDVASIRLETSRRMPSWR